MKSSSHQKSREIDGNHTEILLQFYSDRILVLVTQMCKVGCLIQASLPQTFPLLPYPRQDPSQPNVHPLPAPPAGIELTPLLGSAPSEHMQTLHSLYASQIATIIWTLESDNASDVSRRSVIVGISLRKSDKSDHSTEDERVLFLQVMSMLWELLTEM